MVKQNPKKLSQEIKDMVMKDGRTCQYCVHCFWEEGWACVFEPISQSVEPDHFCSKWKSRQLVLKIYQKQNSNILTPDFG